MLQRLQAADHRLDPGAHLFVALHEARPLSGEMVLPMPQRAILFAQGTEGGEQVVHLFLEAAQFSFEARTIVHVHPIGVFWWAGHLEVEV
jgi:hypothetical protein